MTSGVSFDDTLARLGAKGPEFGPGLSNHGPMAAEALVALGRGDAVDAWGAWYARRLEDAPRGINAIDPRDWREALGDIKRAGDWMTFFRRELSETPWREALERWVPRLAPGIMAGATHGVLRTAHAVRSLDRGETPLRVRELGDALAYWAGRYQELPQAREAAGVLHIAEAVLRVPRVDHAQRRGGLIFDAVKAIDSDGFARAVETLSIGDDEDAFVSDITRTFVRYYITNADRASISFIHTVTAPSACRILAPHLSPASLNDVLRYAWHACAAVYAAYVDNPPGDGSALAPVDAADLIEQAVAARDEHAIKFTEACLREHALSGDAAFLAAAQDAVVRLKA